MSTINVANLELQIVRKIANTTSNKELAILNKALYVLQTGTIFTVGTFANLPDASNNVGKLYFVEADALLYFSFTTDYDSVAQWIPITNVSTNVLWSWGCNNGTQLGDGTAQDRLSPVTVVGNITTWVDIVALTQTASSSSVGLKSDGTIWTWGTNGSGQLGNAGSTGVQRCSPATVAGGGTTWCFIFSGRAHAGGIKTDGTLWTWGQNCFGKLGEGTTVSRCSPGTIAGEGTTWCQASGGITGQAAIKTDGTLWTWGQNCFGILGDGTTVSRCSPGTIAGGGTTWCQVSAADSNMAAIKTDGTLWTWGVNLQGQLGDATGVNRCSPGTIAGGGTTWCQVSGRGDHTAVIKTDGTLWTWGNNTQGRLGDGTTLFRSSPGTVAGGGTTWCQVDASSQTAALKTDGTLWTWGCGGQGVLGTGTQISRCSPGTVAGGGTTWFRLSVGGNFMLAITKETL